MQSLIRDLPFHDTYSFWYSLLRTPFVDKIMWLASIEGFLERLFFFFLFFRFVCICLFKAGSNTFVVIV